MALPTPPSNTQPIPNNPFYSPITDALNGPNGPLVVGNGLEIDYATGIISAIASGPGGGTVTQINTGLGLIGGPITTTGTLSLAPLIPNPVGNYSYITHIDVDSYGRVTFLQSGAEPVYKTAYNARGALLAGTAASAYSALPPGFTGQVLTADTACPLGIKWASGGGGSGVLEIFGTSPIVVNNGNSATPTITIDDASLTGKGAVQLSCSLTLASDTVALTASAGKNLQDQITNLNIVKGTVQEVTAALPLYVSGIATETPQVNICPASITQSGAVQLYNLTNSPSDNLALTASAGYSLQQQIDALASASNLVLAGDIDGSTGLVEDVTAVGTSSGFTPGAPLPSPSLLIRDYYVIVTTDGTFTPTGGTPISVIKGDWVLCDGTTWVKIAVGYVPNYATDTTPGIVCLASDAQTQAGTNALDAVTPASLQSKMSDDPSLASSLSIASSCALSLVNALATDSVLCSTFAGKGYTVSGSGVGSVVALAPGTNGQVLTVDSGAAGGLSWVSPATVPSATDVVEGTVFLATNAEVEAGVEAGNKAINPASLQSKVLDSVACDSSLFIASSKAVKLAYDTAVAAQTTSASDTVEGTVCLATNLEVLDGTNSTKAITPTGLQSKVTDSVAITCSNLLASATAVKTAYDAAIVAQNPAYASTLTQGVVCLATNADVQAGLDSTKAITPLALQSNISCCVNLASDTTIASSSAVKTAYDAAVAAATPSATTAIEGKVFLATDAEVQAGIEPSKAVVSSALQSKISNCVDLVSGTTIASSTAVKAAYDVGAAAVPCSTLSAKGSLITATGAGVPTDLPVGSDGQYLVADSTCLNGLKWLTLPPVNAASASADGILFGFTNNLCNNVSFGFCSLNSNIGNDNTVLGNKALTSASNALTCRNTLVGGEAMFAPGAGALIDNTVVGYKGMFTTSASDRCGNTGVGSCVFSAFGAGNYNTFLGYNSGANQASGNYNVALGGSSLQLPNITGSCQLAIGYDTNNYWLTGCSDKSITIPGGIRDCTGSLGAAGQVLSTTGSTMQWVDQTGGGGVTAFSPSTGPTASPETISYAPEGLYGTASAIWASGSGNITATGSIEFKVNAGAFGVGPTAVVDGDVVQARWATAAVAAAADGAILVGGLVTSSTTIAFSMTVDRAVTGLSFTDLTNQATSATVTSDTITPGGYNVPVSISFAGTVTDPLTSLGVSVNGGGFSASPQTVNPGQTVQLQGTTGATDNTTYGVDVTMGSGPAATDTWTAAASAAASIATPSVVSPANGEQDVNVYAYSTDGVDITSSTYTPQNGAGSVQTSATWEVYKGGYPVAAGTTSASSTSSLGTIGTNGTQVTWKNSDTTDGNLSYVYGKSVQDALLASTSTPATTYPLFNWANNLSIMGYTDWYIPALYEAWILYYFLKPTSSINYVTGGNGSNPNSVAPYTPNVAFTTTVPAQTSVPWMQNTAYQSLPNGSASIYWTTATDNASTGVFTVIGNTGQPVVQAKSTGTFTSAFAIRRIPIAEYLAAGSPAIGTYLAGGIYGGQISTTANGVADYALIVAPAPLGRYAYGGGTQGPSITVSPSADYTKFPVGVTISGATSGKNSVVIGNNGSNGLYVIPTANGSTSWTSGEALSIPASTYSAVSGYPLVDSVAPFNKTTVSRSLFAGDPDTYFSRVQYDTTNSAPATSSYSSWSNFRTSDLVVPTAGQAMGGGYFGGQMNIGGSIYNLIIAPKSEGVLWGQYGGETATAVKYNSANQTLGTIPSENAYYGYTTLEQASNVTTLFVLNYWAVYGANGPNAGSFGTSAGTGIGGYNDWYIPTIYEWSILYYFLKAGTAANNTASGTNPYSVAPYTPNTAFTTTRPAQTSSTLFQSGGPQSLETLTYWTATNSGSNSGYTISANDGSLVSHLTSDNGIYARAMRRMAA